MGIFFLVFILDKNVIFMVLRSKLWIYFFFLSGFVEANESWQKRVSICYQFYRNSIHLCMCSLLLLSASCSHDIHHITVTQTQTSFCCILYVFFQYFSVYIICVLLDKEEPGVTPGQRLQKKLQVLLTNYTSSYLLSFLYFLW